MTIQLKLASAVLAGLMIVGCDNKDNSVPNTTTTSTPAAPAVPPARTATGVGDSMKNMQNTATDATGKATDATSSASATATTKLQQVGQLIADKKYDAADAALKQVEAMKASLPDALQQQVTVLRTQFDAAKAANGAGITMPSLPGAK